MAQFLLNRDGSFPAGSNEAALRAAGVALVIPTDPPTPGPGQVVVDTGEPEDREGVLYQRWRVDTVVEPIPERVTKVTPLEFLKRLPMDARVRIQAARSGSPLVEQIMLELTLALEIDLEHPDTVGGVQAMTTAGILTQAEAAVLLAVE